MVKMDTEFILFGSKHLHVILTAYLSVSISLVSMFQNLISPALVVRNSSVCCLTLTFPSQIMFPLSIDWVSFSGT